jgi:hypothetical protein
MVLSTDYMHESNFIGKVELYCFVQVCTPIADPSGRSVQGVGLRPIACWDCGLETAGGMDVCLL